MSKCPSRACGSLAFWYAGIDRALGTTEPRLVYPQTGVRIPPAVGLEDKESKLYEEAAAVARISPRAACALVRALLEAYLKRHLHDAGHSVKGKRLVEVIDVAVNNLDLSTTLKSGLTAIRNQGNLAVHDPYGLTDDVRIDQLPWLFQAVDALVLELDVMPRKWADMAGP